MDNALYGGTHLGVEKCVERNKTDTIKVKTIRALCARQHQKFIRFADLSGRAGLYGKSDNNVSFSGNVTNNSSKTIVTQFEIRISYTNLDPESVDVKLFEDQWIEPGTDGSFSFRSSDLKFAAKAMKDHKSGADRPFKWSIGKIRGVEIRVK